MDKEPDIKLVPTGCRGEAYRSFFETQRWEVFCNGESIGTLWRGQREDGVICWMQEPKALGYSMPDSAVISGYSRTTKKGAIWNLVSWHENRKFSAEVGEWQLHCAKSRADSRTYIALHPDGRVRWVFAAFNETERPHLGAMGGIGWQVSSLRGHRQVIVHDAADLDVALSCILREAGKEPTDEETIPRNGFGLPVERHYPDAGTDITPLP